MTKLDICDWAPEHEKMEKGVTLIEEEAKILLGLLQKKCNVKGNALLFASISFFCIFNLFELASLL